MADKEAVALDEEELAELEMIIIDGDEKAALEFLRRAVWNKVRSARRKRLDPRQGAGLRPRV